MKPLTPSMPHALIMIGIPGAGKTAFSEHFSRTFNAPYINARSIAHQAGITPETAAHIIQQFLTELLKTKQTLIYEGPTETIVQRRAIMRQVKKAGYTPMPIWVQTESAEAKKRATRKQQATTPLSVKGFDTAIMQFQAPTANESAIVISGKHTYSTQVKIILKHLAQARPSQTIQPPDRPTSSHGRDITVR